MLKVDNDYNKTIAATNMNEEAKGDWGAYSHGQLVNTTIYNVRRERRNELCAEGLRLMDVRRWCALDQMITTPYIIEGIKYWGTVYSDPDSPMSIKNAEGEFYDPVVDPDSDDANMSARAEVVTMSVPIRSEKPTTSCGMVTPSPAHTTCRRSATTCSSTLRPTRMWQTPTFTRIPDGQPKQIRVPRTLTDLFSIKLRLL